VEKNWDKKRENMLYDRCSNFVHRRDFSDHETGHVKQLYGVRPYSKDAKKSKKPCYLQEMQPGLWAATGGAKNGTIAAGWAADQISRRTQ
jgi:hypothetical protein